MVFSNSKGNRERQGRDDMDDMYSFLRLIL